MVPSPSPAPAPPKPTTYTPVPVDPYRLARTLASSLPPLPPRRLQPSHPEATSPCLPGHNCHVYQAP
ncbi:hypothetical protein E2C01_091516 [Portunus trituberculatus]|uniref:Uncharacterized protein n=1 Tax=Portunus trituberculatus TaxID=210409 RepID=A0A5B7JT30_PORTR|nr:hypothetical protein [Portunus trituberculatus]